ncbi:MAG: hypothetical protein LBH73_06170, partial [Spirochaetaceae bacterium]|nr:hypothetical protein [Spirochaetaceae bacterium]
MTRKEQEHFIQNAENYERLVNAKLPPGLNADEVLAVMNGRMEQCRIIMEENNAFIDTSLKPIFENPSSLTEDEADMLFDFAWRLHSVPCLDEEGKSVDQFLALTIYKMLAAKAHASRLLERELQCAYIIGEIYHYMSGILFTPDAITTLRQVHKLSRDYLSLKNKKARFFAASAYKALAACLFNYGLYRELFQMADEAFLFYGRKDVRDKDPDFPWEEFENKVRKLFTWVGTHLEFSVQGRKLDGDLVERVYQILFAEFSREEIAVLNGPERKPRFDLICRETEKLKRENGIQLLSYAISAYHTGTISLDRYIDILRDCLKAQFE